MTTGLAIVCGVLFCLTVVGAIVLLVLNRKYQRSQIELGRYAQIGDLEAHARDQKSKAEAAVAAVADAERTLGQLNANIAAQNATMASHAAHITAQKQQVANVAATLGEYQTLDELRKQIETQKQRVAQYNQALGNFKTADELKSHIAKQTARIQELNQVTGKFESIPKLDQHVASREAQIRALEKRIGDMNEALAGASTAAELNARISYQQNLLAELQAQAKQVEEALEMQEFGFYRPRFDFESSSAYQDRLDAIRDQQTVMVKNDLAIRWDKTWMVEGSESKGRKMMAEQTKLMLRAFNGECDAAVAKVKYNNAVTLEARITKSCEQINKLGKTNSSSITDAFLQLKLQELYLVYEHRLKQQQEKEEQQRIKEQMREEEKAQREIELAQEKAERDEEKVELALERARLAFERATQSQREATEQTQAQNLVLATQVAKLENELKDAIDRKAKAIARAQLTKSGHVYILSNIGSFGEGRFKLGLTRRLDPYERVKELGDASVPFPFDVHAIIYSENAPELECKLHRHFADRRVNLVNLRREYFDVTLEEIIAAVAEFHGVITFVKYPEAAEYRETLAMRKANVIPVEPCVEDSAQLAVA